MNQARNGHGRALGGPRKRGPRINVLRARGKGKNHELACFRPGCSRKRGRGRTDKIYCSERCRWKARDEELLRLRQSDFETLVEERACSECQGAILEALIKR